MQGLEIEKNGGGLVASLSALAVLVAAALGVWIGPNGLYAAAGAGLALAIIATLLAIRCGAHDKPVGFPSLLVVAHLFLLGIAFFLQARFQNPLPKEMAKMPRLQTVYEDPDGVFGLRGPAGWTYRPVPSRFESGVRLHPSAAGSYVGISEISVHIRRLDETPESPEAFLENAASAFSQRETKRRRFELTTERGLSLSGRPVFWSTINMKKFWIELYQTTIFGVKDGRYLVSVTVTGLTAHSTLARLFCMGLFERVIITDPQE